MFGKQIGEGDYQEVISAIEALVEAKISVRISFTAHKNNYTQFSSVVALAKSLKVSRVWSDRLVPFGSGNEFKEDVLSSTECQDYINILNQERLRALKEKSITKVEMRRPLNFLVAGNMPLGCPIGNKVIVVMPNGDIYPCRRVPIKIGNVLEANLFDIYRGSSLMRELRDRDRIPNGCRNCKHENTCRGGAKCVAYGVKGDLFKSDPGCWLAMGD